MSSFQRDENQHVLKHVKAVAAKRKDLIVILRPALKVLGVKRLSLENHS